ncbi:MAG: hypothetical protein ACFHWZ_11395 [Phycisphaerales bacterium]
MLAGYAHAPSMSCFLTANSGFRASTGPRRTGILGPMLTSLQWLNRYLDPARPVGLDEAVELLEAYSFPIESVEDVPGGDHCLDVELTSNRGDCFSHLSLAKEIAASSGRSVVPPPAWEPGRAPAVNGQPLAGSFTIENTVPTLCPRFTGRIIRGVKVGPSPDWLRPARSGGAEIDQQRRRRLELRPARTRPPQPHLRPRHPQGRQA